VLVAPGGKHVQALRDGFALTYTNSETEQWDFLPAPGTGGTESLYLQSKHGQFLQSKADGSVSLANKPSKDCIWGLALDVTDMGDHAVALKSVEHDRNLFCQPNGQIATGDAAEGKPEWENWMLKEVEEGHHHVHFMGVPGSLLLNARRDGTVAMEKTDQDTASFVIHPAFAASTEANQLVVSVEVVAERGAYLLHSADGALRSQLRPAQGGQAASDAGDEAASDAGDEAAADETEVQSQPLNATAADFDLRATWVVEDFVDNLIRLRSLTQPELAICTSDEDGSCSMGKGVPQDFKVSQTAAAIGLLRTFRLQSNIRQ